MLATVKSQYTKTVLKIAKFGRWCLGLAYARMVLGNIVAGRLASKDLMIELNKRVT